ncbi:MAG: lipoprotein LprG [Actinomycetota bacterium]|nr:lipoprotein LprG [Actinomycetota bacterium]
MLCRRSAIAVLLVGLISGCTSSAGSDAQLPDGVGLVTASAQALTGLHSVRFKLGVSGTIPGLPIRQIDGDATLDGSPTGTAKGHADMQEAIDRFQVDYVLTGDKLLLTRTDGTHQELPAPPEYLPSALLEASGGLHRLLTGATDLKTEVKEKLGDVETYRVAAKLPKAVISSVIPGIQSDVDVKFWVEQAETRRLIRVWMQVPPIVANEGAVMLELALSNLNVPVN